MGGHFKMKNPAGSSPPRAREGGRPTDCPIVVRAEPGRRLLGSKSAQYNGRPMPRASKTPTFPLLAGLAVILAIPLPSVAQPSGRQTTPDSKQVLVNRAQGGLQWAISYTPGDGTITGNVFDPAGGEPQFIWCERMGDDGSLDPREVMIDWRCEGSFSCTQSPCLATNWNELATVPLPGSFFLPARDPFIPLQLPEHYCDPIRIGFLPDELAGNPSWEVDTAICEYATMVQTTQTPIEAGEDVWVRIWNWALEEPEGGVLLVSILLGDEVLYSDSVDIPKPSGLLGPEDDEGRPLGICVRPSAPVPAGTPVAYHLQIRPPAGAAVAAAPATEADPDLGRPFHSTPGVVHMLDLAISPGCEAQELGRRLVTHDTWERVSTGVREVPRL